MKKLLTSAFIAFTLITVNASAQAPTGSSSINTQASDIARRMMNEVQLNESEYIQVRKYTAEKLEAAAQIQSMYSNDPEMMTKKLNEAEDRYNFKLQSFMNPKQFSNYMAVSDQYKVNASAVAGNREE
ncbi:hypothetical protein I5M27_18230 [Adhaeribacter sp. BT258]|uniref:DUF4168 domain-containing protein n=1 Tax=Adhaeribacter terrigena TaxID=2793070 RepID=A0ABS1C6E0_9BACT|nr:hypothetical protein [Adhaeribacter terrigena]MBK0404935.1 hypothetical protein [Adhaeribacter terrigena]